MLVATSEGVGGAVDGTSAETLLWSPQGVELVTLFKSPWRNQLQPGGGSAIVPSTGQRHRARARRAEADHRRRARRSPRRFEPVRDPAGKPRPWDIEFGFADGKLWLFQCRPFLGNDELKNVPALAPLEGRPSAQGRRQAVARGDARDDDGRGRVADRTSPRSRRSLLRAAPRFAALEATDTTWDGSEPPQGIYFHWYEPSFYTGFAPRTQDPTRVHIQLSRGNQVRVTVVLGDAELDAYLDDLVLRREDYQELIDAKVIELTTNKRVRALRRAARRAGVAAAVASAASLGADAYRQKSVEIMSALNPERVFRIKIPLDASGRALARAARRRRPGAPTPSRLDAANAILPGRVNLYALSPELAAALARGRRAGAHRAAPTRRLSASRPLPSSSRRPAATTACATASSRPSSSPPSIPAGTIEGTTTYKGEKLPDFGVTGVWPLIRRTQGPRHHSAWSTTSRPIPATASSPCCRTSTPAASCTTRSTTPACAASSARRRSCRAPGARSLGERDGKKPYQNLWIVSRGPTSHGCTRLASGHMSELRQIVPSESNVLERVATFRNLPQCYDVFDIDGDGTPEVMGVQYYLAYKSNEHTPIASYVTNQREPFYRWLYGDNIDARPRSARRRIKEVPVCRFVGEEGRGGGRRCTNVPLYEASSTPETIQFYTLKPAAFDSDPGFEFNRELRKVGAGHPTDRGKLLLK